ncbi:elongation factor G [Sunxiuqinia elliptica]|uniref:Elongation factor G n=1 Tax=Sunxiuqinia elliptica TaxID=655355 RepID=A0A1I2FFS2_9BACT|nr:elongation factor G [Sunxiuqinia elliptica]TDO05184.1 translation elongation factor 2 (EF-2/EF-G) [Sunxiuqinia elliptica]TDO64733.1 translation elongation factor 2 (EF-2/EF-G) [Sunxiuqinia elliptica]SFF04105.1 elongation factor G [Sunxiuqinia elliptica]
MKIYKTDQIRNIALVGNAGSGKTTLAEAMLFEGGVINRRGEVTAKNTTSDYLPIEQDYGNSVFSSVLHTFCNDKKINIIDTPGMDDFRGSVISALHVVGCSIVTINTSHGIEAGTESVCRYTEKAGKPMIFAFNQLDHENVNFDQAVDQAKSIFGNKVTVVQYPVNAGPGFDSIIDVLKMKLYKYPADGGKPEILDIPADEKDKADELHNELVEMAAENDEALMELYFDKGTLTEDEMRQGIKLGMIDRSLFPVFCTGAKHNMGVGRLMEFIANITPSPAEAVEVPEINGKTVDKSENAATSLMVFKTTIEQHVGEITYFKVMSGTVKEGQDLIVTKTENKERISQIFVSAGKNRTKVEAMIAGDIGATVKMKDVTVNNTLSEKSARYKFAEVKFPTSRHTVALKAVNEADEEKVGESFQKLHDQDPTFIVEYSKELKQMLVHCQGEYHLNALKWFYTNEYKIDIEFLKPKIPYRETITKSAQADYRHKKQSGGAGQFGEVHMIIEPYIEGVDPKSMFQMNGKEQKLSIRDTQEYPLSWGGKLIYHNCIVGGSIDGRFMPAILKGIMEKMEEGPLTGSYARDIRVYVYDGKMHPVDSNEISFKLAGRNAFSTAFKNAGPKILEPIYNLEVFVQSERMGDVMSDLQGRRALIMGMGSEKGYEKINAKVPLKEMHKYNTSLSSITQGRGMFSISFDGYEKVPQEVQDELLASYAAEQEED